MAIDASLIDTLRGVSTATLTMQLLRRGLRHTAMTGVRPLVPCRRLVGEAFTLLTMPPGPDVAPLHSRQIVILPPEQWPAWLDGTAKSVDLFQLLPEGSLAVAAAPRPD